MALCLLSFFVPVGTVIPQRKKPSPEKTPETTVSRGTTLVAGGEPPTTLARNAGAAIPHTLLSEGHLPDAFPRKPCRRTRTLLRLADGLLPGTSSVPRFYVPYFITVKRRCQRFFCPVRDFQRDLQEKGRQIRKKITDFTKLFSGGSREKGLLHNLFENTAKNPVQKGETHDTISGGVIENNRCVNNGGGIHISESAALNVSGDPAVTGNRKGEDLQNVNLANGALIHVTGKLEGARIGVSVSSNSVPTAESPRPITTGLSGNGSWANFFSDDEDFYVWGIDGEAKLLVQDLSRDINMDGKVNALDLLVLRKNLVGLPVGSFDPEAADVNGDEIINILDLVRLRKILGQ